MRLKTPLCLLGLLAALAFSLPAAAQDAPAAPKDGAAAPADGAAPDAVNPDEKPKVSADADAVARLALAAQLAEQGRKTRSPLLLAAAAELYAVTSVKPSGNAKTGNEGAQAPAADAGTSPEPVTDATALYAEAAAAARAASNDPLAETIEKAAAAKGSRQPVPGSGGENHDRVNPYDTDFYNVRYRGGEIARATAIASGDYDIDLYVYNGDGQLVAYDNDSTSIGICSWVPSYTRNYSLRVKNTTGSYVYYYIYTN
ncbi:MAG: hypothetical protein LBW85_05630 [Deltaproteobacteria bacterium]|jgi:hypothetical protein|nr:hypothetical protein [Deltaproteobacteria bacterium]